ncbi:hypothetical protein GCM10010145_11380 [Streptomyces ruber]|uniref:SseB protein N-terminal domain-containing protein n=2 Tax=Streptomyces TaxID=1883 RepID=A0A918B890_9ACTN|nr:type VII secretion system-associated protein [Streptomyces ruber]GGQ44434.1 hypothetical protein GCM10010145_11380 [Streptomyces ruber]
MRPGEQQEARPGATVPLSGAGADPATGPQVTGPEVTGAGTARSDAGEPEDVPEIPEAVRAAALRAPGHWIGVVDPEFTEERTPPEWAVLGEWRSDESGGVGTYRANPAYRPSARVLGWPEPTDPVDAAAQRAATGYGSVDEALAALAEAEVTVVAGPDGKPLVAAGQDGAPVVLVFTSSAHAFMSSTLAHDTIPARELARSLSDGGTQLLVNAGAVAPLLVPADRVSGGGEEAAPVAEGHGAFHGSDDQADRTGSSPEPWPHTSGRFP